MKEIERQEKEFYSKLQVAGSIKFVVGKESDEFIGLTKPKLTKNEKFSRDLATILARKKEAVAVNLTTYPDYCIIYISKNSNWLQVDFEYIKKIQECLIKISKYDMKWEEAFKKADTKALSASVIAYCSGKFESRLDKLKRDIRDGKNDQYIKSFIEYASNSVDINHDKANKLIISRVCCCYYKKVSKDVTIPKEFLKHLKKVGSYMRSLIDITSCACNKKYKVLFSNMKLHILKPIVTYQPIFSWKNIIQGFIPDPMEYENFKNACLSNKIKASRLAKIYDGVKNLELESIKQGIYLHAEMNILNEIINQKKKARAYIAVSKKCCYLCELYIKFAQKQGYNIVISGTHKKIYNLWKLPTDVAFKSNFLSYVLKELDKIIQEEIDSSSSLLVEFDSDESNVDKIKVGDEEHNANLDAKMFQVFNI